MDTELIKVALRQHGTAEDNWINVMRCKTLQWLYTLKAIACLCLGRERAWQYRTGENEPVIIARFDFQKGYDWEFACQSFAWSDLLVGHDWRQWWYAMRDDGTP